MSKYILDWDTRYRKGVIKSSNLESIRLRFSVEDTSGRVNQRYRNFKVPSRRYSITAGGRFDIGLGVEIVKYIKEHDALARVIITDAFKTKLVCKYDFSDTEIVCPMLDLRDYQIDTVRRCLKVGRGVCDVATAGGKTLITSSLISTINANIKNNQTVFITKPSLVKQTHDEFIKHGIPANHISMWDGKHPLRESKVIIASVVSITRTPPDVKWMDKIDLLIVDECHIIRKKNKITKIIEKIKTPHKFGLTGTLPEEEIDLWQIMGIFGPVIYEKRSHSLISEGYISRMCIQIMMINYDNAPVIKPKHDKPREAYELERAFLFNDVKRNSIITKICDNLDNNILILVDQLAHGDILRTVLEENLKRKDVYFIQGSVSQEIREEVKKLMESKDNIVCVAMSKIFSTGIDIKNLHFVMFASGGKSKTTIIQSIGRGLRKHESKMKLVVFDIADKLHYGIKHHQKRLKLYDAEKMEYSIHELK